VQSLSSSHCAELEEDEDDCVEALDEVAVGEDEEEEEVLELELELFFLPMDELSICAVGAEVNDGERATAPSAATRMRAPPMRTVDVGLGGGNPISGSVCRSGGPGVNHEKVVCQATE
jgi:hypothetical protein